jgi:hypothetical protein
MLAIIIPYFIEDLHGIKDCGFATISKSSTTMWLPSLLLRHHFKSSLLIKNLEQSSQHA